MVQVYGASGLQRREQAWELLARAVQRCWGLSPLPETARGERGKPYFPQFPQYQFNLSHSGHYALCALSDAPVGADIQVVRPTWSPRLVERSCTPEERAWLSARGDRPQDFAALWACKESAGKRSGYGLPYPPSRLAVPLPKGVGEGFSPQAVCAQDGRFFRLYAGTGWQGAVCAQEPPPEEIFWLDLF